MSDVSSFVGGGGRGHSAPAGQHMLPVDDIYRITKGGKGAAEWGIDGYEPPKSGVTQRLTEYSVGKSGRTFLEDVKKRSGEPDPTKYKPTMQEDFKRHWSPSNGPFKKGKRNTFIDNILNKAGKNPGPGAYFAKPKGQKDEFNKTAPLGRFGKSQGLDYTTTWDFYGYETPGAGQYLTKPDERDKIYSRVQKRTPSWKWYNPKQRGKSEKSPVGPGTYKDLDLAYSKSVIKERPKNAMFLTQKRENPIEAASKALRHVPGVGKYENAETAYTKHVVVKRSRVPFMPKANTPRFTETYANSKKYVPGPGAYEILPKSKYDKRR